MALIVALVAGLLVAAESQASDRSDSQGFLDHYDKFIAPNLNQVKQANGLRAAKDVDLPKVAAKEEENYVQKLFANGDNNTSITLSAIGFGLLALVTMLGFRIRRAMQPATVLASSGPLGSDMSINMAPGLGDNIMEMESQGSNIDHTQKDNSMRVGWGQMSSQKSPPLTLCYATQEDEPTTPGKEDGTVESTDDEPTPPAKEDRTAESAVSEPVAAAATPPTDLYTSPADSSASADTAPVVDVGSVEEPDTIDEAKQALLVAIEETDRGFDGDEGMAEVVRNLIQDLCDVSKDMTPEPLDGDWTLLWTDAPDIIALQAPGPLAPVSPTLGRIGQEIDAEEGTIVNVIEWKQASILTSFRSELAEDSVEQRVVTEFKEETPGDVKLKLKGVGLRPRRVLNQDLDISLPDLVGPLSLPFGNFRVLYNDGFLRVAKTSQGFYSINERYYGS
jgi:hypothetical protein